MDVPRITVGISCRNGGPHLRDCLASLFAQSLPEWELVFIDDGSQDQTMTFMRSIRDPRVRLMSDGRSLGLAARLNQLTHAAAAPIFARMDADDIMHPTRLEAICSAMGGDPDPTLVVGSNAFAIDATNRITGLKVSRPTSTLTLRHGFIHPTVAASTAWFRAHPYSEEPCFLRCEDAELWCRCASSARYVVIPTPLLYYREVGVFSLANYLTTNRNLRHVLDRHAHGWPIPGLRHRCGLQVRSALVRVADALGLADTVVRARSRPLPPEAAHRAAADLRTAVSTPIPGLDHAVRA